VARAQEDHKYAQSRKEAMRHLGALASNAAMCLALACLFECPPVQAADKVLRIPLADREEIQNVQHTMLEAWQVVEDLFFDTAALVRCFASKHADDTSSWTALLPQVHPHAQNSMTQDALHNRQATLVIAGSNGLDGSSAAVHVACELGTGCRLRIYRVECHAHGLGGPIHAHCAIQVRSCTTYIVQ
jgi:hypothetical protein